MFMIPQRRTVVKQKGENAHSFAMWRAAGRRATVHCVHYLPEEGLCCAALTKKIKIIRAMTLIFLLLYGGSYLKNFR